TSDVATQIDVLANLQIVDQSLRAKTLAVEEGQGRVAALEEAVQAQSAAAASAREELTAVSARQQDLETRLSANETKLKDRRMRLARIRSDKDLGVARREVDLLKEETGTIENELISVLEQVEVVGAKLRGIEEELARLRAAMETEAAELRETVARRLPERPANAILARREGGGERLTDGVGRAPEEVEQPPVAQRGGRKVRTPQDRVAVNGGLERSGESATEKRPPRATGPEQG